MDVVVPLSAALGRRDRLILRAAVLLLGAVIAAAAAHTLLGVGGAELDDPVRDWASSAAYVLVALIVALRAARIATARLAWTVLAIGMALYAAGNLLWALWLEHVASPPIPSISDALWLSLYPASYIGIVLLAQMGRGRVAAGVWLDGVIAGLGIATLGSWLVFGPVLDASTGGALAVATNLAYPVGDLLLAALVVAMLAVRAWRVGRSWALLGAGFLVLCGADWIYLLQVAHGSYDSSSVANLFYMSGVALLALGAWQPQDGRPVSRRDSWWTLLVPSVLRLLGAGGDHRRSLRARGSAHPPALGGDHRRRAGAYGDHLPRRAPARRDPRPGRHRRPDGAPEPPPVPAPARWGDRGRGRQRRLDRPAHDRPRPLQGAQRRARPPRRRPRARPDRAQAHRACCARPTGSLASAATSSARCSRPRATRRRRWRSRGSSARRSRSPSSSRA